MDGKRSGESDVMLQEINYVPTRTECSDNQQLKAENNVKRSDTPFLWFVVLTGELK